MYKVGYSGLRVVKHEIGDTCRVVANQLYGQSPFNKKGCGGTGNRYPSWIPSLRPLEPYTPENTP